MRAARRASVPRIVESALGSCLFLALGCSDGGPLADLPDVMNDLGESVPVQCATALDCPERECLVVAGCVSGRCRYTPIFAPDRPVPCTPRSPCYGSATCDAEGRCVTDEASRKACDDGNPCTEDLCDDRTGSCLHDPLDGLPCDDGDRCTEDDRCVQGSCRGGAPSCPCLVDGDCPVPEDRCAARYGCSDHVCVIRPETAVRCPESPEPCEVLRCVPADGSCRPEALEDGIPCDDGNACTVQDACVGGTCQGETRSCEDGDPCTEDVCDPETGTCSHRAVTGPACDDGDPCTTGETCQGGMCGGGVSVPGCCRTGDPCDDGDPCTSDACDPGTNGCVHDPIVPCCGNGDVEPPEECDDGNGQEEDGCSGRCEFQEFVVAGLASPPLTNPAWAAVALSDERDRFLVVAHNWHPTQAERSGIWGRMIGLDGQMLGNPVRIETSLSLTARWPAVASIGNRGFLVAWRDAGVTRYRRVGIDGTPVDSERTLTTDALRDVPIDDLLATQEHRVVALHAFRPAGAGERVALLAWMQDESPESNPRAGHHRIYYAILQEDPEGSWTPLRGHPKRLESTNATFWQWNPRVVSDQSQNFLLLWTARDPSNRTHFEHRAALIRTDGTVLKEVLIRDLSHTSAVPSVSGAHLPSIGAFGTLSPVVGTSDGHTEVRSSVFDGALEPLLLNRLVFTEPSPSLAFLLFPTGSEAFVVGFSTMVDPSQIDLKVQRLTGGLYAQGAPLRLHRPEPALRYGLDIAPHPRGGLFATWISHRDGNLSLQGRMLGPSP